MVIRLQRLSPDTCKCSIDIQYDDTVDPIVFTPINIFATCVTHTAFTDPQALYNVLMEENPRKNTGYQHILDNSPTSVYDIGVDGNRKLKNGILINWSWTGTAPNRVITFTITGVTLTNTQKNTIQNTLNTKFGAGKVVLG